MHSMHFVCTVKTRREICGKTKGKGERYREREKNAMKSRVSYLAWNIKGFSGETVGRLAAGKRGEVDLIEGNKRSRWWWQKISLGKVVSRKRF